MLEHLQETFLLAEKALQQKELREFQVFQIMHIEWKVVKLCGSLMHLWYQRKAFDELRE